MNEKDNNAEIISLKKKLGVREKELHIAAKYGQQLLEQTEVLKQEKHSLQLKLETQMQSVKTQMSEIESCVKEVDCLKKKNASLEKELSLLKQRNDNCIKEKQDLEKLVEDLQLENSTIKSNIAILKQQVETFKNVSILDETKCEENLPDVNELISKIKTLEDFASKLQVELESTKLNENRLMQTVKELEEAVSDRDKNLSSEVKRIADLQETIAELQCEIETLKLGQLDVNKQGNSMFAELDDRRKNVEKQFKDMSKAFGKLLTNYEKKEKELISCKVQLSILACSTSKKHQEDQIKKLRAMHADAMHKKRELSEKLSLAEKALLNKQPVPPKGDQYNYLRVLIRQAEEKVEKVGNELIYERLHALDYEEKYSNTLKELYACQEYLQALKTENLELKQEIKKINSKPEACEASESEENLHRFESTSEKSCGEKLIKTVVKENVAPLGEGSVIPKKLISGSGVKEVKPPKLSNEATLHSFHPQNNGTVTLTNENSELGNISKDKKSNCAQQ